MQAEELIAWLTAKPVSGPVQLWPGHVITDVPKFLKRQQGYLEGARRWSPAQEIILHHLQRLKEVLENGYKALAPDKELQAK